MSKYVRDAKVKTGENDLYTWCINNGERGKQLLDEWVGLNEFGEPVDINRVSKFSAERVQWKCKYGHTWIVNIYVRTYRGNNCKECAKKSRSIKIHENRFKPGVNDLYTWCINHGDWGGN
jgi:hypothetical protein